MEWKARFPKVVRVEGYQGAMIVNVVRYIGKYPEFEEGEIGKATKMVRLEGKGRPSR